MKATPEQRLAARLRSLLLSGMPSDEAEARAREIEGLPPAPSPADLPDDAPHVDVEALTWKHACETRRADAATKRAARVLTLYRAVVVERDSLRAELDEARAELRQWREG